MSKITMRFVAMQMQTYVDWERFSPLKWRHMSVIAYQITDSPTIYPKIKASYHLPLWEETNVDQWIPLTKTYRKTSYISRTLVGN